MENEQIPIEVLEQESHVALCNNDPVAVRAAMERGADPNSKRIYSGKTPLWFFTFHGMPESLAALLECGATVPRDALEAMGDWEILDCQVSDAEDALRYLPIAQALLERGAGPDVKADGGELLAAYWSWLAPIHSLFVDAMSQGSSTSEIPVT